VTVAVWIAIGAAVLGLLLLGLISLSLLGRLRTLKRASDALKERAEEAEVLQARLEGLQPAVEAIALRVEAIKTPQPRR
jgi:hypothetical protein